MLHRNGFPVGRIDGDFGPRTFGASKLALEGALEGAQEEPDKSAMIKDEEPIGAVEKPQYAPEILLVDRPVSEVIWHCAATPEGRDFTVEDIRAWHKARGWSDIGYHFVVYRDGSILPGRPLSQAGAHVRGRNTGTIGCVYIGGVAADGKTAKDTRTAQQKASMVWLTKELIRVYQPGLISGHNQYAAKACPSFDVRRDLLGNLPGYSNGRRV